MRIAFFIVLVLVLSSPLVYKVVGQEAGGPSSVVVRVQKQPGKPWTEYHTRTLEQLPGFALHVRDSGLNAFGGRLDQKGKAKGFFYAEYIGDRWWLIDPDGCQYYNKAVVSVAVGKSETSLGAAKSLFGSERGWADATTTLLFDHGFNGTGAWTDSLVMKSAQPRIPYTLLWNFMGRYGKQRGGTFQQPGHTGYPNDCMFVFDREFETFADEYACQLATTKDDPYLIGHFSDNELPFPPDALDRFLQLDPKDSGFKAAEQWLRRRKAGSAETSMVTDEDREGFLELVADRYFSITSRAIRRHDPNHLLLGSRFYGKTLNLKSVFVAAGRYVDIVSVNYYNTWTPDASRMQSWVDWSGRPIIITEWYVKGADAGLANSSGAGWIVPTQYDRGLFYQHFALGLLQFKGCVGWQWFKYIDNDPQATGVDPSNNDSNKGIVSIRCEPYGPLLDKMKDLNSRTYHLIEYFDGQAKQ